MDGPVVVVGSGIVGVSIALELRERKAEVILVAPDSDPVVGAMPTGSARLTAAFVEHDPPSWFEIDALRAEAKRLVEGLPAGHPERGVLVGGSSTNLCRVTPEEIVPGVPQVLGLGRLERAFAVLATFTAAELVAKRSVNLRRARILTAGAALAEAVLIRYGLERLEVSDASLREGAILAAWMAGDAWPDRLPQLVAGVP